MPFGSYDTPKPTPIPTFLQYLKSCGQGIIGKTKFGVEIIWLPGKFDNVTLQTHAFRYICDNSHPLYQETIDWVKELKDDTAIKRLEIVITSIEDRTITIAESPKKLVNWKPLGTNAIKFVDI